VLMCNRPPNILNVMHANPRTSVRRNSFKVATRFIHDISVAGTEHGSVVMDGWGFDLNLDHHRRV
jgi:hypothetical protein